jgi:hypothetical protein
MLKPGILGRKIVKRRPVWMALTALLICQFAGCSGCGSHADSHAQEIAQATAAVAAWMMVIDQGNYGDAYEQTGAQFKKMIGKDAWVKEITPYRAALGKLNSRKLQSAEYSDSVPDLQPGQYVLLKYATSFQLRPDSQEEITAQIENDGVWRPLGYYVRFTK